MSMPAGRSPEQSRQDRELIEFLNEVRVVLPGVQVLFAFLLTVPFLDQFEDLTTMQRTGFLVAFLSTTASAAFLIAPSSFHRLRFRARDKEAMIRISNRLAIAGIAFLALAMSAVVFVVMDLFFESVAAVAVLTTLLVGLIVMLWYGIPLTRQLDREDG